MGLQGDQGQPGDNGKDGERGADAQDTACIGEQVNITAVFVCSIHTHLLT